MSEPSTIRLPDDVEAAIDAILVGNVRYKSRSAFLVEAAKGLIAQEQRAAPGSGPDPTFYVPFRVGGTDSYFMSLRDVMRKQAMTVKQMEVELGVREADESDEEAEELEPLWAIQAVAQMTGLIGLGVRDGEPEWAPLVAAPHRWFRMCNLYFEQVGGKAKVLARNLSASGWGNVFSGEEGVLLTNWSHWENPRRRPDFGAGPHALTPGLRRTCVVPPPSQVGMAVTAVGAPGAMAWFRVGILAEPAGPDDRSEPEDRPSGPGPYAARDR